MTAYPVVVIGHVDHGKTSLVGALTGTSTDTLAEEIKRGLSIQPGFAHLSGDQGLIDLIDAPGHDSFIRAAISAASSAGAALLVISATDGVQPQTYEHLNIIAGLGIRAGIIAVTKSDLIDPEQAAPIAAALRKGLADSVLSNADMVFCSAQTGDGLDDLSSRLAQIAHSPKRPAAPRGSWLSIDRAFTIAGRGSVVTATLQGAPLSRTSPLVLSTHGQPVDIRSIQTRGEDTDTAVPGQRTAIGLRGVAADTIQRGDVLYDPEVFAPSDRCDAAITLWPSARAAIKYGDALRVFHGASRCVATLRLYHQSQLPPGDTGYGQIHFPAPIIAYTGQRLILRRLSPPETIGYAAILDPVAAPARHKDAARLTTLVAAHTGSMPDIARALIAEGNGLARLSDIARLTHQSTDDIPAALPEDFHILPTGSVTDTEHLTYAARRLQDALATYHANYPLRPVMARLKLKDLKLPRDLLTFIENRHVENKTLVRTDSGLALPGHRPLGDLTPDQMRHLNTLSSRLKTAALTPPSITDLTADRQGTEGADLLELLIHSGEAVRLHNVSLKQTLVFHSDALTTAKSALSAEFANQTPFTTGQARKALNTTRKYIVPLLEHFDTAGITQRQGDYRTLI